MDKGTIEYCIGEIASRYMHKHNEQLHGIVATVLSVDIPNRACSVTTVSGQESTELDGVMLMADIDDGFLMVPSIGSTVIIGNNQAMQPFIAMFSEIDSVLIITGNQSFSIKDGATQFNDGSFGGLVQVANLTKKMNNIESLLNSLIGLYNGHTHASNGTPTVSLETNTLTPTQRSDIENTNVTHGATN